MNTKAHKATTTSQFDSDLGNHYCETRYAGHAEDTTEIHFKEGDGLAFTIDSDGTLIMQLRHPTMEFNEPVITSEYMAFLEHAGMSPVEIEEVCMNLRNNVQRKLVAKLLASYVQLT